jgi:dolichyl-phosphate beta-glucosyltransferase
MAQPWIVVPCYNEACRLDRTAFDASLAGDSGASFVFVDDGSTDDTAALLAAIAATNPARASVIVAAENRGKAEAVRSGMLSALEAGAGCVGFWDADLATPLAHITEFAALLDRQPDIDVVMGTRVRMLGRHIDRSGTRHLIGRAYATLASVVLGLPVYDTQCGAKLFRRSPALEHALEQPFRSRWSFDVELLQRLQRAWGDRGNDRILEVPLPVWRDVGNSNVSLSSGAAAFAVLCALLVRNNRSLPLGRTGERAEPLDRIDRRMDRAE